MAGHESVLLNEAIEALAIKPEGIYVDGTFGRGGHSREILQRLNEKGRLIAIDKDKEAVDFARHTFGDDKRFSMVCSSFAKLADITRTAGVYGQVDGILLDLGVSSPQLDNPLRGFSFQHSGPLDMRMDIHQTQTAADFVNRAKVDEMEKIFRNYGEERFARRIARAIEEARKKEPILTTGSLAEIVKKAHPKWEKHKHPATRVFQAIRIHINQELHDLSEGLKQSIATLAIQGRLAVISFHSLEDRIVKQFMQEQEQGVSLPSCIPVRVTELKTNFKRVGRAIKPAVGEIQQNPRARSAVLRIGEKIA